MVNIKYIGHMKECRIKVNSSIINKWKKNEVKDIDKDMSEAILKNTDFIIVGKVPIEKIEEDKVIEEPKEVLDFDLNGDGVVDRKDTSIAGKVMANARRVKRERV